MAQFIKSHITNNGRFIYPNRESPKYIPLNITRDWNQVQGTTGVEDDLWKIRNSINERHISIENSSQTHPIGVAIQTYYLLSPTEVPKLQFVLRPNQIKDIAINSHGSELQYIYLLNPKTNEMLGSPSPIQTDGQQYVIRDGLNKWWVHKFKNAGYYCQK